MDRRELAVREPGGLERDAQPVLERGPKGHGELIETDAAAGGFRSGRRAPSAEALGPDLGEERLIAGQRDGAVLEERRPCAPLRTADQLAAAGLDLRRDGGIEARAPGRRPDGALLTALRASPPRRDRGPRGKGGVDSERRQSGGDGAMDRP